MIKLNIGSNDVIFQGWENLDLYPRDGVIQHDARMAFPYGNDAVDYIFSEHFIEHLNETEAVTFFRECFRMLKSGGVVRTATFNFDTLSIGLLPEEWGLYSQSLYGGTFANKTRGEFLNLAIYEGGAHKHMYNPEEMIRVLNLAGFNRFEIKTMKDSKHIELQNLEWRCNSDCIIEATK